MSSFKLLSFLCVCVWVTGCSGDSTTGRLFAPDPSLQNKPPTATAVTLPTDFPNIIPIYPQAKLDAVEEGKVTWTTTDTSNIVFAYYQEQLASNNWQIEQAKDAVIIAQKDTLRARITITPVANTIQVVVEYKNISPVVANPPTPIATNTPTATPLPLSDVSQKYIQDLQALGVLDSGFNANEVVTRRQYARWLVIANNKIHANSPAQQIRLGTSNNTPAFKDVTTSDADFPYIQGLAEAGIIPSTLSGDNAATLFNPDGALTRETLVAWKVPLDNRKPLPLATLEGIKQTWGFQDAAKIDPKTWRSLYTDYQNGELSNLRRVFGYTTLFQPKKVVTQAEAATALWYFGVQGEGISAEDSVKTLSEKQN